MEQPAIADIGLCADREVVGIGVRRQHHRQHRQPVVAGKVEVALIVRRAAEDGPGAVVHQHEIGDEDGQHLIRQKRVAAGQAGGEAALLLGLELGLAGAAPQTLRGERGQGRIVRAPAPRQRMIGCQRHERGAEQRIWPGGEHLDRAVALVQFEPDAGAARSCRSSCAASAGPCPASGRARRALPAAPRRTR